MGKWLGGVLTGLLIAVGAGLIVVGAEHAWFSTPAAVDTSGDVITMTALTEIPHFCSSIFPTLGRSVA
ncbi:MAG: hypothetical protein CMH36_00105 [Microbacterium sp.]|uniref:hypothetical protein n=1 Tax=uncultured Microbacterium sp. TaxID=191216 RepID=UPI000C98E967|nr:hypothetical protein [uncultured Microbacterium sp.]MAL05260.1 hypothetical protein [Microbacterium sp.]